MNKTAIIKGTKQFGRLIERKSPAILIFLGISGMCTTVVMACKATPLAIDILDELEEERREREEQLSKSRQVFEEFKCVAPVYIPSAILGALSIGCIIGSYSISTKRIGALAAAYQISENTLKEYQRKVIETVGEKKELRIRDEIAKDRIEANPPVDNEIILTNNGEMLCYDKVSGRYFYSSVDAIRKAESILNRRLISEMYVSLNDFYDEIDIPHNKIGDEVGWNIDDLIEFFFSSQLTKSNVPCLVIDYGIGPRYDFRDLK